MIDICCKYCGHKLVIDHFLDDIDISAHVNIWCVICGHLSTVSRNNIVTNERRTNIDIVEHYRKIK